MELIIYFLTTFLSVFAGWVIGGIHNRKDIKNAYISVQDEQFCSSILF